MRIGLGVRLGLGVRVGSRGRGRISVYLKNTAKSTKKKPGRKIGLSRKSYLLSDDRNPSSAGQFV